MDTYLILVKRKNQSWQVAPYPPLPTEERAERLAVWLLNHVGPFEYRIVGI